MGEGATLLQLINGYLEDSDFHLPVYSGIALDLQQLLDKPDFNMNDVVKLIHKDQSLSTEVLRVANSAFFSGMSEITTIKGAIIRLGAKQVLNCVILITQKNQYSAENRIVKEHMEALWKHALACALGSMWFSEKLGYQNLAREAFLAGLLHDSGKLFLLRVIDEIERSKKTNIEFTTEIIAEILDNLHPQYGYLLLKKWNLPEAYCIIARDHHKEEFDENDELNMIVRVVNQCCLKLGIGLNADETIQMSALPEVGFLGPKDVLLAELEITLEDTLNVGL